MKKSLEEATEKILERAKDWNGEELNMTPTALSEFILRMAHDDDMREKFIGLLNAEVMDMHIGLMESNEWFGEHSTEVPIILMTNMFVTRSAFINMRKALAKLAVEPVIPRPED